MTENKPMATPFPWMWLLLLLTSWSCGMGVPEETSRHHAPASLEPRPSKATTSEAATMTSDGQSAAPEEMIELARTFLTEFDRLLSLTPSAQDAPTKTIAELQQQLDRIAQHYETLWHIAQSVIVQGRATAAELATLRQAQARAQAYLDMLGMFQTALDQARARIAAETTAMLQAIELASAGDAEAATKALDKGSMGAIGLTLGLQVLEKGLNEQEAFISE